MKILIVNFSDSTGGAARAAYRLHKAIISEGIDSKMLVLEKKTDESNIISVSQTKKGNVLSKIQSVINNYPTKKYKSSYLFSASFAPSFNIAQKINDLNPDIVHLHWINAGMLKIEDLKKIKATIVWSLHDMWPFTGGCHHAHTCMAYTISCGNCPVLQSEKKNDLSKRIFNRKQKVFSGLQGLTIIGLSKWLASCAEKSMLFKSQNVINIPNPINIDVFKPFNKKSARELWRIPQDKKLILFGAMDATSSLIKGFKELKEALEKLKLVNVELLVFGSTEPKTPQDFNFKTRYLGQIHDSISLVTLYSSADVVVVPSLYENLSNVIMESLACGTPVVAFNTGGNGDLIDHKENGYLATPFDTKDLANGIEWVLNNIKHKALCENAREKVLKQFDSKIVARKYIDLYNKIIDSNLVEH